MRKLLLGVVPLLLLGACASVTPEPSGIAFGQADTEAVYFLFPQDTDPNTNPDATGSTDGSTGGTNTGSTDGSTGTTDPGTGAPDLPYDPTLAPDPANNPVGLTDDIDTGDVGGPILFVEFNGSILSPDSGADPGFRELSPDDTPIGRAGIVIPETNTDPILYWFEKIQVVHYDLQRDENGNPIFIPDRDADGNLIKDEAGNAKGSWQWKAEIGSGPAAVRVTDIERIETDYTRAFTSWKTSRIFLKSGGYVVARGPALGIDGHIRRWAECLGATIYFAVPKDCEY